MNNNDHFHTHGPDELAMLRAECDKWHKAYDRVWEERMRFADRAIDLEKENSNLKRDNEQLSLRADNWKSLCFAGLGILKRRKGIDGRKNQADEAHQQQGVLHFRTGDGAPRFLEEDLAAEDEAKGNPVPEAR